MTRFTIRGERPTGTVESNVQEEHVANAIKAKFESQGYKVTVKDRNAPKARKRRG